MGSGVGGEGEGGEEGELGLRGEGGEEGELGLRGEGKGEGRKEGGLGWERREIWVVVSCVMYL